MQASEVTYKISISGREIIHKLQEVFTVHQDSVPRHIQTFYDTFDWRLYKQGSILRVMETGTRRSICWEPLPDIKKPTTVFLPHTWHLPSNSPPAFAGDLPHDGFRDHLARLTEARRLLPVVQLQLQGQALRLLDQIQKTVVRVLIEQGTVRTNEGGSERTDSIAMLRLIPVRGYEEAYWRLRSLLEQDLGLIPISGGQLAQAMAKVGLQPGDYSAKPDIHLDPHMPAAAAAQVIHQALFRVIRANEIGVRQNLDPEFLHDFRVAIRRTRSALSQIKQVFPEQKVAHFLKAFAWLGQVTGPVRDLDVYLLKIDTYKSVLSASIQEDLNPLYDFIHEKQKQAHRHLATVLDSARYKRLMNDWYEFLTSSPDISPANASRDIQDVASERIWKVYRRLYKNGREITSESPAEALHNLRKQGKKLRYLMEFFHSLYPAQKTELLAKTLKRLHDNLGDFNDYEVQQASLRNFADQMMSTQRYPAATFLAMGYLLGHMEKGQKKERKRFRKCFSEFFSQANRQQFQQVFKPGG